jgi:hypothetical protein
MHFPMFQPVPAMGGASPVAPYNPVRDKNPSGFTDPNDFAYNWNLTSAYYSMRLS